MRVKIGTNRSGVIHLNGRIPYKKETYRVVLLQGPVGPFFACLQKHLEENNFDTWRISFNAGDHFYCHSKKKMNFSGSLEEWNCWFDNFLRMSEADCIVLFGAQRDVHIQACRRAKEHGVPVIALEEGYIRPGYITVENDGNNATSPLAGRLPPNDYTMKEVAQQQNFNGFAKMCRYAATYYTVRTLFSSFSQRQLFHRRINLLSESYGWVRNAGRHIVSILATFGKIQRLLEHWDKKYFLVPLQLSTDSQLTDAALGWNNTRLIMDVLKSFAHAAPERAHLVFKIHPMERGHSNDHKLIKQTARLLEIDKRVHVLNNGSLGLMTRHSAGMITINSTSGLSAIYHGVPLLVIGQALYTNKKLATCAFGNPFFDAFWADNHVADKSLRLSYINWVKNNCLKSGDFYHKEGIELACQGVLSKIIEACATKSTGSKVSYKVKSAL